MTKFIIKKKGETPELRNPVLIEGLPGIGNVARLSVDYLIDKLGAEKLLELYSDAFPNSVTIKEDSTIKLFSVELYHARVNGRDLLFLSGDVQPTSDAESFALSEKVVQLAKDLGVNELITIGGIGLPELPEKVKVHCVVNDESIKDSLKKYSLVFDGADTVRIILGATGLLLGVAQLNNLKGFSLLAETYNHSQHIGIKEAREVLKVLIDYLGIKLDFTEINEEIKSFEQEIKQESKVTERLSKESSLNQGYIG